MGPWFFHWYGLGNYLLNVVDFSGGAAEWIMFFIWFCLTVGEQIVQIIMMPKLFKWVYIEEGASAPASQKSEQQQSVEDDTEGGEGEQAD